MNDLFELSNLKLTNTSLYEFKLRYQIFITAIVTFFVFALYLRKKYIAK